MRKNVSKALVWIKNIIEEHEVSYQIVGGMAANIHGGSRPVADIDLYIPKMSIEKILPNISNYISKPLSHYVDYGWDVEYIQLIYQGKKSKLVCPQEPKDPKPQPLSDSPDRLPRA